MPQLEEAMRDALDLSEVAVKITVGDRSPQYLVKECWLVEQAFARIAGKVTPRTTGFTDITEALMAALDDEGHWTVARAPERMSVLDPVVMAAYFQDALIIRYRDRDQQDIWFHVFCFGAPDPQPVIVPWYLCVDANGNVRDTWRRLYYPTFQPPWPWPVLQPNQHWAIGRLAWIVESTEPSNPLTELITANFPIGEIARSLHRRVRDCLAQARSATTTKEVESLRSSIQYLITTRSPENPLARLLHGNSPVTILGRQIQDDLETIGRFIMLENRGEASPELVTVAR